MSVQPSGHTPRNSITTQNVEKKAETARSNDESTKEVCSVFNNIISTLTEQTSNVQEENLKISIDGNIIEDNTNVDINRNTNTNIEINENEIDVKPESTKLDDVKAQIKTTKNLSISQQIKLIKNQAKDMLGITKLKNTANYYKKEVGKCISKELNKSTFGKSLKLLGKGVGGLMSLAGSAIKTITYGHFSDTASAISKAAKADSLLHTLNTKGREELNEINTTTKNDIENTQNELNELLTDIEGNDIDEKLSNLKQASENDIKGEQIKAYSDAMELKQNLEQLKSEEEILDKLTDDSLTFDQKTMYVADLNLDATAAVGNSMWSAGFTASFLFPPAAGLAALGGTVFLASKAIKATNNLIRTMRASSLENTNTKNLNEKMETIQQKLNGINNENMNSINENINNIMTDTKTSESEKVELLKKELDSVDQTNFSEDISSVMNDINELANEMEKLSKDIESQTKEKWDAAITGLWDVVNFGTWSIGIYALGGGAETAAGPTAGINDGLNAVWDHISDPNNILTQMSDAPDFAKTLIEGDSGAWLSPGTSGMVDWAVEAFLFKAEANIQNGEPKAAEENSEKANSLLDKNKV